MRLNSLCDHFTSNLPTNEQRIAFCCQQCTDDDDGQFKNLYFHNNALNIS